MNSLAFSRRVVGRSLMIVGHIAAIALAVLVPVMVVVYSQSALRMTGISALLMIATLVLIIGGDRLVGYVIGGRPQPRSVLAPERAVAHRPFMLADTVVDREAQAEVPPYVEAR